MSEPNVELVERFLARVNADELDAALLEVAPDAVLDWSRSEAPDGGVHRGHEAWRGWMDSRREGLSEARFETSELVDLPPERVLVVAYMRGVGRASGFPAVALGAAIVGVRDGTITAITLFQSRAEAMRAAGLSAPEDQP
jgi:ketosteroid isomerase-like protein